MPDWITRYWIEWLFGVLITAIGAYSKHISVQVKREREEQRALRDGMRSLLRRQILLDCELAMSQGYCETAQKDIIEDMYKSYHALGGNGVVSHIKAQVINLPSVRGGI